jgi:hypothetical protein
MADVAEGVIGGPVRDWLAAQRAALNNRFRLAQRRYRALDPEVVLALCREVLPPLAGSDGGASAELLSAVYDLILLHAGRGTLTPGGGSAGIHVLLRSVFPTLRLLLAARPRLLPGALSNAVENLGPQGAAFARTVGALAPLVAGPDELLDAGAVVAWRLGDARLRSAALDRADHLPPAVVLTALGLPNWPPQATPLLLAGLRTNGWTQPEDMLSAPTRAGLGSAAPDRLARLRQELLSVPDVPPAQWRLAGRLGNFLGFDGHFERPPVLLAVAGDTNPHRFRVRCGKAIYCIDADAFGWVCTPGEAADFPAARAKPPTGLALPPRTTSVLLGPGVAACTTADSFRVRILAPPRKPL